MESFSSDLSFALVLPAWRMVARGQDNRKVCDWIMSRRISLRHQTDLRLIDYVATPQFDLSHVDVQGPNNNKIFSGNPPRSYLAKRRKKETFITYYCLLMDCRVCSGWDG